MYDVITIGSATQDVFLQSRDFKVIKSKEFSTGFGECFSFGSKIELGDVHFDTGGGGTNTAVTFSRLGLKTAVITRVGEDPWAQEIVNVMRKEKVAVQFIIKDKKHLTAYSTILLTRQGERTILVFRGASRHFSVQEIPWSKLKTKWFYVSSLGGNIGLLKEIINFADKKKIKVAVNPGGEELGFGLKKLAPILKKVKILILNREEASKLSREPAKDLNKIFQKIPLSPPLLRGEVRGDFNPLSRRGNPPQSPFVKGGGGDLSGLAVITDGAHGAYVSDGKIIYYAPSLGNPALNATGAGDAFGSAFTAGIILENNLQYALRLGILNSGMVITEMGAKRGLLQKLPSNKILNKIKIEKLINPAPFLINNLSVEYGK